ncbi:MAG TPA: ATP-binding protein [Propionibacteriaceae bacterium]|nr:ATP-binding protein [Propionibacteriaceae bacterium]
MFGLRTLKPVPIVVAVASIGVGLVGFVMFDTDPSIWRYRLWLVKEVLPGTITFSVAGAVLLGYPKARAVGIVLLASGCVGSLYLLTCGLWYLSTYGAVPYGPLLTAAINTLGTAFFILSLVALPQVFPDGLLPGRRWIVVLVVSLALQIPTAALTTLREYSADIPYLEARAQAMVTPSALEVALWNTPLFVGGMIGVLSLLVRWRHGSTLIRQQIAWLGAAASITIVLLIVGYTGQDWIIAPVAVVWPLAVVTTISIAVLQYHLYDVRVVVQRVAVYGALTGMVTLLFVAAYSFALASASTQTGDARLRWAALVVAAAAVVLLAEPARRWLGSRLESRLLGERHEPLRALARLQGRLVDGGGDEEKVLDAAAETVAAALRSPGVAVALHRGPRLETVAISGAEGVDDPLVLPLLHRGERLGELRIAQRTPGERFSRADVALIDQLANQTAALVSGLRRDLELAQVRRESLQAMADVRARLGRDLHDGIAPLLAGAGLTAEALRRGMPDGTADERAARQLASRLRRAAGEIRRLAYDLQLAASADGTLEEDVRSHLATLKGPTVPEVRFEICGADALTSAVRQGLYLVILEAMNNVVRHAHARHVQVTVNGGPDHVALEVRDDGIGIHEPYVSGLGITSMRSRVQALGGSFDLAAGPAGGTRLSARVPVRA